MKVGLSVPVHWEPVLSGPLQEVLPDPTLGGVGGALRRLAPLLVPQGQGAVHPGARVTAVTARLQVLSDPLL